jgi:hypothetical protein
MKNQAAVLALMCGCLILGTQATAGSLPPVSQQECEVLDNLIEELDSLPPATNQDYNPQGFSAQPRLRIVAGKPFGTIEQSGWNNAISASDLATFHIKDLVPASLKSCRKFLRQVAAYNGGLAAFLRDSFADGTHVWVSRVLFNDDASLAYLEYDRSSGPLGLEQWFLIFRRDNARWKLIGWRLGLVS